ncbi:glycosyltransferase family 2 protein [uncultured Cetobacterium sp.]|uniref:glycosyltransferase family 2 protein n=1 Tax=uncultured Cetobacterium sp. TaxID=527638 RepID=UPI0025D4784D|nr:glycosyltransferase family 2 protein [uncultured Cetobacterium sp.]
MMNEKLVSVIVPNYNCEKYIGETLGSILEQSYKNIEIIIIDDCSTDNSYSIALNYSKKYSNIIVEKLEKNSGAGIARNRGIELATGEYIAFLDSDDIWHKEKLKNQIRFMEKNNYAMSFTSYEHINEEGKRLGLEIRVPKKVSYNMMLWHDYLGCLTVVYNQRIHGKVYSEDIRKNNDYSLFLNILKKEKYAYGLREPLAKYRIRKGSISRNKLQTIKPHYHLIRSIEKKSVFKSVLCIFSHFLIKKIYKEKKLVK